jgi:hypothetical protein
MPSGVQTPEFPWDFMRRGMLGRSILLLIFGALLGLLIVLGYGLRDYSEFLTIMWPASGLLLVALWSSPTSSWIWILMTQLIVQMGIYLVYADRVNWRWGVVFAAANSVDAIVAAAKCPWFFLSKGMDLPRPFNKALARSRDAYGAFGSNPFSTRVGGWR